MTVLDALALAISAAGIAIAMIAASATGQARAGILPLLELWTAAGLLRLAGAPSWSRIASVAAVIAIRKLVMVGLRRSTPTSAGPAPG
jgi:hypothetical protein